MEERFEKIYTQGKLNIMEIWVDKKPVCNMFTICLVMRVECRRSWVQMGNHCLLIYLSLMALSKVENCFLVKKTGILYLERREFLFFLCQVT